MPNSNYNYKRNSAMVALATVFAVAGVGIFVFANKIPSTSGKKSIPVATALQKDARFGLDKIGNPSQSAPALKKLGAGWTYKDVNQNTPLKEIDDFVKKTGKLGIIPVLNISTSDKKYPSDEATWKSFIGKIVGRYDGDGRNDMPKLKNPVKHWHIVQEWKVHWKGTVEEYVSFLNMTGGEIKKEDGGAKIILVGIAGRAMDALVYKYNLVKTPIPPEIMEIQDNEYENEIKYILNNGKYDIADFHSYEKNYLIEAKMKLLREIYKINKPVWVMEAGGPFLKKSEGYTDEKSSQFVIKQHVQAFAAGVEKYIWALATAKGGGMWDFEPWVNMPLLDANRKPKPSFYAFSALADKLKNLTKVENMTIKNGAEEDYVYAFKFANPGNNKSVYVLWSDRGAKYEMNFPEKSKISVTQASSKFGWKNPETKRTTPKNGKIILELTANPIFVEEKR